MINILSDKIKSNPYSIYTRMRDQIPVCEVQPPGSWALTRYDDVEFALKNDDLFSAKAIQTLIGPQWLSADCRRDLFLSAEDPPIHTPRRALINKTFVSGVINALIPLMRETAQGLITQMKDKSKNDFIEDFTYPYINKIMNKIIGLKDEQNAEGARQWIQTIEKLTIARPSDAVVEEIEAAIRRQISTLTDIIHDRKENPCDDLVSQLVNTSSPDLILTEEMQVNILDLFVRAGYMASAQSLASAVIQLSRHPHLVALLREDPSKIPMFIEEIIRLYPPAVSTMRQTTQAIEMHGVTIPENSLVFLYLASANRDPAKFSNPDEIDLFRNNPKDHISFGTGIHLCIGLALARLEIKIAVETLLQNVSHIECPDDTELDWFYSTLMQGVSSLPIDLTYT